MNKKWIDNLVKNWPAKVICLTIAIFLYLFYQASLIDKKTFVIPLEVIENGIVVHVGDLPTSVVVSVRANENDIKSIFASDMKASINLSNLVESGTYKVPIDIKSSDRLKSIDPLELKLKEERLKIVVERRIRKYVKVVPSIVGDVLENYEIDSVIMDPSMVQIEGPESLVKAVPEVYTGKVNVSNAKTPFSVETNLTEVCDLVRVIDMRPCKATINVVPKVVEREYNNVPINLVNLNETLEYNGMLPIYNIKIKGKVTSFKKFDVEKNPINIDLSEITEPGEYEVPVNLKIPEEFDLVESSGDVIYLKIVEKDKAKLEAEIKAREEAEKQAQEEKNVDTDKSDAS